MTAHNLTRRRALAAAGAMLAGSKVAPGPAAPVPGVQPAAERAGMAPRAELVNTLEYEEQAKLKLTPAVYSLIAGGDRGASIGSRCGRGCWSTPSAWISASRCLGSGSLRRS
jgi:hypothetical protein